VSRPDVPHKESAVFPSFQMKQPTMASHEYSCKDTGVGRDDKGGEDEEVGSDEAVIEEDIDDDKSVCGASSKFEQLSLAISLGSDEFTCFGISES
jgi:hypothetical protein